MINFLKVMLFASPALLLGCQSVVFTKSDLQESEFYTGKPNSFTDQPNKNLIDKWLSQKKFSKVLQSLESIPVAERSKKYQIKIYEARKLAEIYEIEQSEKIEQLYNEGHGADALKLLEVTLTNYAEGNRLLLIKKKITKQQTNYIREVESQILLAKGEWLLLSPPLYKELLNASPGNKDLKLESKQVTGDIIATASRLTELGIYALAEDELQLAEQRLTMANDLHPTGKNISALARLDKLSFDIRVKQRQFEQAQQEIQWRVDSKKRVEAQRKKREKEQRDSTRIVESIYYSLARGELMMALNQIKKLELTYENNQDISQLRKSLDKLISKKVTALLNQGSELYSNGQIKNAKVIWESAVKLDPNNVQLNRRIKRANQVLSRLQELQNK